MSRRDEIAYHLKLEQRAIAREERRKDAARERGRLLKLHAIGATSIDEQRQLFPTRYPQRID
jgi:hypothetical protein